MIGVPGAASIASLRVTWPPADPHAALQVLACGPGDARQFEAGGVPGRVISRAIVPGVDMAIEESEVVRGGAGDLCGDERHRAPAGFDHGAEGRLHAASLDMLND